ncbi:tRNA preQ1(34) S-adenosylmethionine ribosyltransferase-isomerase QueA [Candidatus Methylospira mobilis]|uniref:S-adenosylmethionine:tRNA ribosyltransferase-isomerase n=1 Tax=Candidatus Methylospira mobilis TaxID=1808979 RepID=A0A5Q0BER2_9GAMM|nr:tRNA preQ1(34) S-adenosylmethionine ribosyltransferase-isomerase QueA [Candidatus Methylospira mobilis]QFY42310.1 tRNA preQ1(34) S-adenosylmethionine ribosyltransferase-isomerase QueA [Candidatus Methylospira mobilis]WNV04576.1 tRNA preQ1(34) S-adenosylmethionine ribosyltransferase-isomerase QueA [Candidatus Methylospira mobilis]
MKKSDFYYPLDVSLIAQAPAERRGSSRLLYLDGLCGGYRDLMFQDILTLLKATDVLVVNDTRVIPARLYGRKASGGRIEMLVERILTPFRVSAQVRASKTPRSGTRLIFDAGIECEVVGRDNDLFILDFHTETPILDILQKIGQIPLPPYIAPDNSGTDHAQRYQTVYAAQPGAVAAPTAGLHFDDAMLEHIAAAGIRLVKVTLHVGSGTFRPLKVENLDEHVMHSEYCEITAEAVSAIQEAMARGGRVIAVGTTSLRVLETAARGGELQAFSGDTDLFIRPGFEFNCVDALLTNFHLPESTLLTLVCAFAGYEHVMRCYRHAVEQRYRFFSYGDAMFVTRKTAP